MNEYVVAYGPVRYMNDFEKSVNFKRKKIAEDNKVIVKQHFCCDGGYLFCIFEVSDEKPSGSTRRTKAKARETSAS